MLPKYLGVEKGYERVIEGLRTDVHAIGDDDVELCFLTDVVNMLTGQSTPIKGTEEN